MSSIFLDIPDNFIDLDDTPTTYSGSGLYYVSVRSTTDGLEFVDIVTTLSGIKYKDFTPDALLRAPAGVRPGFTYAGPVAGLAFDDTSNEYVFGSLRIPENTKSNEDCRLRIYALNDTAQSAIRTCKWCIEYHTYDDDGENYTGKSTTTVCTSKTLQNNAPAGDNFNANITLNYNDINNPLTKELLTFRIYRDANDVGDTLVGDAVMTLASFRFLTEG